MPTCESDFLPDVPARRRVDDSHACCVVSVAREGTAGHGVAAVAHVDDVRSNVGRDKRKAVHAARATRPCRNRLAVRICVKKLNLAWAHTLHGIKS